VTGAEVRRIRDRLTLTQAALARALGVTRVTVARWETGVDAIPEPDCAAARADPQRTAPSEATSVR
jgi:DNA-binding transcriptional regulator YiaG